MLESHQIDQLRTYVDALPLDDIAVFQLLAGLNGEKLVAAKEMKDALGCTAVAANKKIAQAFRRLRMAMGLREDVKQKDILEALIVAETRRKAQEKIAAAKPQPPKEAAAVRCVEPEDQHAPAAETPKEPQVPFDKLFQKPENGTETAKPETTTRGPKRAPQPQTEETP